LTLEQYEACQALKTLNAPAERRSRAAVQEAERRYQAETRSRHSETFAPPTTPVAGTSKPRSGLDGHAYHGPDCDFFSINCEKQSQKSSPSLGVGATPPSPGAINPRTGEFYAPAGSGYVGTRDGTYYAPAGPNGVINTRTGEFVPLH
jgi:hypothetical protein